MNLALDESVSPSWQYLRAVCRTLEQSGQGPKVLAPADAFFYQNLWRYLDMLMSWNKRMNLIGKCSWEQAIQTLCADSWYLADFIKTLPVIENPATWDLGAGAGLPGVPLRLIWGNGNYTLVEVREKRALFLQTVLATLALPNTFVFRGRAELFMPQQAPADLIISRAFLPWKRLLQFIEPFTSQKGLLLIMALQPAPSSMEKSWETVDQFVYEINRKKRFFWALQRRTELNT